MAAVSLVPSSYVLSDACEQEQLRCCYQHQIWCCLSLWIYVVILASLKKKFPFVHFVFLSNSEVCFLFPNLLPLPVKLSKPTRLSQFPLFFHLILSLVSSSPVSEEEMVHVSCFPSQGWEQPTGCLSFSWDCSISKVKTFPKIRDSGFDSVAFTCIFSAIWTILWCSAWPPVTLQKAWVSHPSCTMSTSSISKCKICENEANGTKNQSVPNWITSLV